MEDRLALRFISVTPVGDDLRILARRAGAVTF